MNRRLSLAIASAALLAGTLAAPASAVPLPVSVNIGCGQSRMRDLISAVRAANERPTSQTTTINLKAGCTYRFYRPQSTRADVGNSALSIKGTIVIDGNNATIRRMAGTPEFRLFLVKAGASLDLSDVTLVNGRARSGKAGAPGADPGWTGGNGTDGQHGGGIHNQGTLSLDGVTLTGNAAGDGGDGGQATSPNAADGAGTDRDGEDAAQATGGDGGNGGHGGAIYNAGTLTMVDSSLTNNSAGDGGAGGTADGGNGGNGADNLAVGTGGSGGTGGRATAGDAGRGGDGGAVYNIGTFSAVDLAFDQNAAGDGGPATAAGGNGGHGGYDFGIAGVGGSANATGGNGGRGGAFANVNGSFTLTDSTIDESSGGDGGDASATGGNGGNGGCSSAGGMGGDAMADGGEVGDSNFYDEGTLSVLTGVLVTNTIGGSADIATVIGGSGGAGGPTCPGGGVR